MYEGEGIGRERKEVGDEVEGGVWEIEGSDRQGEDGWGEVEEELLVVGEA